MNLVALDQKRHEKYRYYDGRRPHFSYMTMDEWEAEEAKRKRQEEANEWAEVADITIESIALGFALFICIMAALAIGINR